MSGVELIAAERQRQIDAEGWTPEHDDTHELGELAQAAACFALNSDSVCIRWDNPKHHWDYKSETWTPKYVYEDVECICKFKEDEPRVRQLVKAGALIAAEIDRIQRP